MTGSEIADWVAGIWYDLLNLDTADVPMLVIKLAALFVAVFFGWQLVRMVVRTAWSVAQPLLWFVWRVVSAPVWVPWRFLKWLVRPVGRWRRSRRWRREERMRVAELRAREQAEAERQVAALAAARQILDVD